jgi:3-phenylpropionate/cinnamic acid dioxygenase small subunit
MEELQMTHRLAVLNARYARSLDAGRLEEWPQYFAQECSYRVTTRENHARGLAGGLIYAKGKGMLLDRVQALRSANIYEGHWYRHIVGTPLAEAGAAGSLCSETPFAVVRTMRTGEVSVFASGVYIDRLTTAPDGGILLVDRLVVCDSSRIDTLLAVPL